MFNGAIVANGRFFDIVVKRKATFYAKVQKILRQSFSPRRRETRNSKREREIERDLKTRRTSLDDKNPSYTILRVRGKNKKNMVKLTKKFLAGDKVFAKVRGYPAWPARIEGVTEANTKNAKYNVYFYGTGETAVCKVEELFVYLDNKDKFTKPLKRKIFHDGIQALEKELKSDKGKASSLDDLKVLSSEPAGEASEKMIVGDATSVAAADSDMESGPLVIDEGDKKKPIKRKTMSATPNNPDTPEAKKKRGRGKGSTASIDNTPKQEMAAGDSQGEEASPGKEVVSRSGRKIKPKRFADFSSSEETEVADKNENSTRSRGKSKVDESNENQASPSTGRKKASTEKKSNVEDDNGGSNDEDTILKGITDTSFSSSKRSLLARTLDGQYVGIKLDIERPLSFDSERARLRWQRTMIRSAMRMKTRLESGEILTEHVKDSLDFDVNVPEDDKKILAKDGAIQRKKYKLRWLRIEAQLLKLDAQIKSNLGLDRADADKCLQAMDDMLALPIDPLMLKKHPHIVETVKRLRRYIGNLADWKLSEDEATAFKLKAEQIKQKAEHIYNKFKAMFTIPEGQSFWQSFSDQALHFKELTKDMPEEKMLSLMADPACPDGAVPLDVAKTPAATTTTTTTMTTTTTTTITTSASNDESALDNSTVSESDNDAMPTRCETPTETAAK